MVVGRLRPSALQDGAPVAAGSGELLPQPPMAVPVGNSRLWTMGATGLE